MDLLFLGPMGLNEEVHCLAQGLLSDLKPFLSAGGAAVGC